MSKHKIAKAKAKAVMQNDCLKWLTMDVLSTIKRHRKDVYLTCRTDCWCWEIEAACNTVLYKHATWSRDYDCKAIEEGNYDQL